MSRIFQALERIEQERQGQLRETATDQPASARLYCPGPSESPAGDGPNPDEAPRIWRTDFAHGNISGYHARREEPTYAPEEPNAVVPRCLRIYRQLELSLREIAEAIILKRGWKSQGKGWVTIHLVDPGVDAAILAACAMSVAKKLREPVLLVDADLKGARLSRRLRTASRRGLGDLLRHAEFSESDTVVAGRYLTFLPTRPDQAPQPAWVTYRRLFEVLRTAYSCLIVVCPMNDEATLRRLFEAGDESWLWCMAGQTPQKAVVSLIRRMSETHCELGGTVLVTREE